MMMASWITLIGICAATLTTGSFLPQVIKTWRTRDTRSLSLLMYVAFSTGTALWLLYGILIRDLPIIAANVIACALSSSILVLKLKNG